MAVTEGKDFTSTADGVGGNPIEVTLVTTGQGVVGRQVLVVGDPETPAARAAVKNAAPAAAEYGVVARVLLYDAAGNALVVTAGKLAVDGSGVVQPVSGAFWQATQPVSAAALPLPAGASTEATLALIKAKTDNLDVALSTRTKPADTQPVSAVALPLPAGAATEATLLTRTKPADTQKVDGSAVTQPVSAAALPLPAGAATEATLLTRTKPADSQLVGAPVGTPAFVRLSDGASALIAQKTGALSVPVVPASDYHEANVSSAATALNALNAAVQVSLDGMAGVGAWIAASNLVGTITWECSFNGGTTWIAAYMVGSLAWAQTVVNPVANTAYDNALIGNGPVLFRARVSAFTSGSATVTLIASKTASPFALMPSIAVGGLSTPLWVSAVAGVDNAGVARTVPVTAKGTQGAVALATQDLKDSGRVAILWTAEFSPAAVAEALLTITESRDGAAVTTFTTKVVTTGKRLRISAVSLVVENTLGVNPKRAKLRMRFNTAGAVTTASPLQGTWAVAVATAVNTICGTAVVPIPDGVEYLGDGTKQIGFTLEFPDWVTAAQTGKVYVTIAGFEY
jgi:hypothetical protein